MKGTIFKKESSQKKVNEEFNVFQLTFLKHMCNLGAYAYDMVDVSLGFSGRTERGKSIIINVWDFILWTYVAH